MHESQLEYFNGKSARSSQITLHIIDNDVQILDDSDNKNVIGTFNFKDCSISFLKEVMFFYLDIRKTTYVIIPPDHILYPIIKNKIKEISRGWFNRLIGLRGAPLIALFITLLSLVYTLFITVVPWIGLRMISTSKEIDMGKNFYSSYIKDVEVDTLATVNAQALADKIQLSTIYPIKVTVVKDTIVNAFAMPGGNIIVYSGILNKIQSPEEFAALLGHESTHINQRHGMKFLLRSISSSLLFSIILNDLGNISGSLIQNADQLRTLGFSRSLEQEADLKGMELMIKNNINPSGMKSLMEDLQKANKDAPEPLSFISTHPLTVERIKSADQFLKNHSNKPKIHPDLNVLWKKLSDH